MSAAAAASPGAPYVECLTVSHLVHKWNSTLLERARQLQALVRRRPRGQMPQIGTDPTPPCPAVVLGYLPRLGGAVGRRTWARASAHHARTPGSLGVGGSRPRRRLPFPRA